MIELRNRFRGSLVGLATGDALGTTLEFHSPGSFTPIADMVGGGPFGLAPGQWTDDTSMALCLAESLVHRKGFDPHDQMRLYLRWYREGYLSSTGKCFDIGVTVSGSLQRFELHKDPFAGETDPRYGGNGSLMRLAPVPLAFAGDLETAWRLAGEMSRTTHGAPEPVDACRYYSSLIVGALAGHSKETLLDSRYAAQSENWSDSPLAPNIAEVAFGSFKHRNPPDVRGTGYVVHALEAALWSFWNSNNFEEGALLAVNLGDDADTTGAIYGQLAGAYYGIEKIPQRWRERITYYSKICDYADGLLNFNQKLADTHEPSIAK